MKSWHKALLVLVIVAAVVLAVMYRRSNYETPESIVTAVPATAPSPPSQGGIPDTASKIETSPTTVVPTQMPQPPVESVKLPEPTAVVQGDFQDVNLPLTPIVAGSSRGVRAYDLDMVDTNEPLISDNSVPGLSYGTPPALLSLGLPTETPPQQQEEAYTGKSMYTELNVDSQ